MPPKKLELPKKELEVVRKKVERETRAEDSYVVDYRRVSVTFTTRQ